MEGLVGRNNIVRRHGFPSCLGQGGRDRFVVFLWRRVLFFVFSRFAFFKYFNIKNYIIMINVNKIEIPTREAVRVLQAIRSIGVTPLDMKVSYRPGRVSNL